MKTGQILQVLRSVFGSPNYKPPQLPIIALKVHAMSKKPRVSLEEIVDLIEQDSMLAADVLRIAGSAAYSSGVPPRTISEAVIRLGLDQLKSIVWESAMTRKVFRADALERTMKSIRRHSIATAHIARMVAYETPILEEQAFLHGLLHNVGLSAIVGTLADMQRQGIDIDASAHLKDISDAQDEAGDTVASLWGLDPELSASMSSHRNRLDAMQKSNVVSVVTVADYIARSLGYIVKFGNVSTAAPSPTDTAYAFNSLNLASKADSLRDACARLLAQTSLSQ